MLTLNKFFLSVVILASLSSEAKMNVVTTTTTLASITRFIGGNLVEVKSITKGPQDPHFVEAKPSFMRVANRADLLIYSGLDLEVGWLSNIVMGARNPKILPGENGNLDASRFITPIGVLSGPVDRAQGDIHKNGNPHYLLSPQNAILVAQGISERLSSLDPKNKDSYKSNLSQFKEKLNQKIPVWTQRVQATKVKSIVSYHKTLNYFLRDFHIKLASSIEPKPGIPPSAKHIMSLLEIAKNKTQCFLVESFFEASPVQKISKHTPIKIVRVGTEVESLPSIANYISLIEQLVVAIEACQQFSSGNE